jgi:hypothetical protein
LPLTSWKSSSKSCTRAYPCSTRKIFVINCIYNLGTLQTQRIRYTQLSSRPYWHGARNFPSTPCWSQIDDGRVARAS